MTFGHGYWCLSLTEMCFDESLHPDCLSYFEFTVWFPHKQHMHSALFHHLHPWSQVWCRGAKTQSSRWRSQQESCPSYRCTSCSQLSVRLRPRSSGRCVKIWLFICIIVNNAMVLVTCIFIGPFQPIIHHNDFYFSSRMIKMLFSETTNQSPSWF